MTYGCLLTYICTSRKGLELVSESNCLSDARKSMTIAWFSSTFGNIFISSFRPKCSFFWMYYLSFWWHISPIVSFFPHKNELLVSCTIPQVIFFLLVSPPQISQNRNLPRFSAYTILGRRTLCFRPYSSVVQHVSWLSPVRLFIIVDIFPWAFLTVTVSRCLSVFRRLESANFRGTKRSCLIRFRVQMSSEQASSFCVRVFSSWRL